MSLFFHDYFHCKSHFLIYFFYIHILYIILHLRENQPALVTHLLRFRHREKIPFPRGRRIALLWSAWNDCLARCWVRPVGWKCSIPLGRRTICYCKTRNQLSATDSSGPRGNWTIVNCWSSTPSALSVPSGHTSPEAHDNNTIVTRWFYSFILYFITGPVSESLPIINIYNLRLCIYFIIMD